MALFFFLPHVRTWCSLDTCMACLWLCSAEEIGLVEDGGDAESETPGMLFILELAMSPLSSRSMLFSLRKSSMFMMENSLEESSKAVSEIGLSQILGPRKADDGSFAHTTVLPS